MFSMPPDLAVILVSWNTRELILSCITALPAALGELRAEIWVVDNGSNDGSVEALRTRFPTVKLIANQRNVGFAAANNQALRASAGRYALLLNSDTVPEPGSIERLVRFADNAPQAGLVGGLLLNPDSSFQYSYADFPSLTSELLSASGLGVRLFGKAFPSYRPEQSRTTRRVDVIPGACMLARRTAFTQVGLMAEDYFMYSEEPDWCLRMQLAGWETWYLPDARIMHYGGQSTDQIRLAMVQALYRSKVLYFRKHHGRLSATALRLGLRSIFLSRAILGGLLLLATRGQQRHGHVLARNSVHLLLGVSSATSTQNPQHTSGCDRSDGGNPNRLIET